MPASAPLTLPHRCRFLGWLVRRLYYRRVNLRGDTVNHRRPTLFLLSHRNGATDGQIYMAATGGAPSLISIQLLRHWYLRLFFAGIPVVRDKDRARYGLAADAVPSPVRAAIAQIKNGGSLCLYPEGTSAWQAQPLPYQGGMAVIAARLKAAGVDFAVQPLAAHYSKPDGFKSRVSIIVGTAFRPQGDSIADLQEELGAALRHISVDTADNAAFNRIQARAWRGARDGADYGAVFLRTQTGERTAQDRPEKPLPATWRVTRAYPPADEARIRATKAERRPWAKVLFALGFPLVAAAALLAGRAADGRNNTTFFRTLGAAAAAVPQAALWLTACYWAPLPALLWLTLGICGWYYYPEPAPVPLAETHD
ncbi:hypothetical protein [uncultured Cardiobacterium sp.]|uniref:hypothetical protein n=1 Tax=uncultured Cardiobacterium sp. TaxID=417619 RepID=UPI002635CD71|nr:hypothetical protein [uncultured Cardiobacterium sp.]